MGRAVAPVLQEQRMRTFQQKKLRILFSKSRINAECEASLAFLVCPPGPVNLLHRTGEFAPGLPNRCQRQTEDRYETKESNPHHRPAAGPAGAPTLCLAPSAAFAWTNRVGVLTVNYTMMASGSGSDSWGIASIGGWDTDEVLQATITGQAKYVVLQTETNLMIGSLISSSAAESASGSWTGDGWVDGTETPRGATYESDPQFNASNACVAMGNAADAGQFKGTCEAVVLGQWAGGAFYALATNGYYGDETLGGPSTVQAMDEVQCFQFAMQDSSKTWNQTITTNVTVQNAWNYGAAPGSGTGEANANNSVTLAYVPDHLTVAFTADTTNGLVPLTVHFSSAGVDSGSNTHHQLDMELRRWHERHRTNDIAHLHQHPSVHQRRIVFQHRNVFGHAHRHQRQWHRGAGRGRLQHYGVAAHGAVHRDANQWLRAAVCLFHLPGGGQRRQRHRQLEVGFWRRHELC